MWNLGQKKKNKTKNKQTKKTTTTKKSLIETESTLVVARARGREK